MHRDDENITFTLTVETLYSEQGFRYQQEKYLPKIEYLESYFGERFGEMRLVDIGVGYGVFLHILEKEYGLRQLYGMDPFPDSIEIAGRYTTARIVRGDITDEEWPLEKGFFDVVTCFDVVEHLANPEVFFKRVTSYLRSGGLVVVTTPNRDLPYRMRSIPIIGVPDINPTHINVQKSRYWKGLAERHGFEILAAWKGEHLTHVRLIRKVLTMLSAVLKLDHRRIPLVNAFEQSFCMVLRSREI
jgi:SAM-dependent methyltransferase